MSDDGSFLARWSKRKHDALSRQPDGAQELASEPSEEQQEEGPDRPFDLSSLPDIDTLSSRTDITAFMNNAVPEALRNAALRKIWALDPAVRNYVGEALDYAWDWNTPGAIPGFGEAVASEQTREFVRNMLAGPSEHENVIDADATQREQLPPETMDEQVAASSDAAPDHAPQITANTAFSELVAAVSEQPQADPQQPEKHRHGGALPS